MAKSELIMKALRSMIGGTPEAAERAQAQGFVHTGYRGLMEPPNPLEADRSPQFFTDNPQVASTYAPTSEVEYGPYGYHPSANVMPAKLRFNNPLVLDARGAVWDNIPAKSLPPKVAAAAKSPDGYNDKGGYVGSALTTEMINSAASKFGHDGVIFKNVIDGGRQPSTVYSVLPGNAHNIRLPWANFDPAKTNAKDFLAGGAGTAIVGDAVAQKRKGYADPISAIDQK